MSDIQPTPETDAVFAKQNGQLCGGANLDFARKLERERDEAREQLEAMREAIKDAHYALAYVSNCEECKIFCADSMDIDSNAAPMCMEALAKLQPFLKKP